MMIYLNVLHMISKGKLLCIRNYNVVGGFFFIIIGTLDPFVR